MAVQYFFTLYDKWQDYSTQSAHFDFLYTFCLKHLILKIQQDIIINVHKNSCKVPVILVRFSSNSNIHNIFGKYSNFMKFYPAGAELLQADGQIL